MLKQVIRPIVFGLVLPVLSICWLACGDLIAKQDTSTDSFSERLDTYVSELMSLEIAPGVAIVVVRENETLFNRGYGMADAAAGRKVTPETVFYIASSTKSFTSLAAAICDERGELDLDETLDQSLADGNFHQAVNPKSISMRQLLTHTHGIDNNGPVSFRSAYSGQHTNEKLKDLLKYHGAARQGQKFRYSNVGYNVAGLAIENQLGITWKELLQREIFGPLKMKSTTGSVSKIDRDRLAMPYSIEAKGFKKRHYGKSDSNMHAAGGLVTTTRDLEKWLKININQGMVDGKQVIPKSVFVAAHQPQVEQDSSYMSFRRTGYGLGWNTGTYDNDKLVHHFGGFSGFHCHISFMPEHKIGVAILVNASMGSAVADSVSRFAYDTLLEKPGLNERFSAGEMEKMKRQLAAGRLRIKADRDRRASRSQELPHPLEVYAGTYQNEQFGAVTFSVKDGKLEARMGPLWSEVEVFDATKNALRVELTGSGQVALFSINDGAPAASFEISGMVFSRSEN